MTTGLAAPPQERLRARLLARYGADADFGTDLGRIYVGHVKHLPPSLAEPLPDPLRDAIAAHYGEPRRVPSTRPRFSTLDLDDVAELTWRDPFTGEADAPDAAGWAERYIAAVRSLAERSGLARLDPRCEGRPFSTGEAILHRWMAARSASAAVEPSWLPMFLAWAAFLPPRERTIAIASGCSRGRAAGRRPAGRRGGGRPDRLVTRDRTGKLCLPRHSAAGDAPGHGATDPPDGTAARDADARRALAARPDRRLPAARHARPARDDAPGADRVPGEVPRRAARRAAGGRAAPAG